MFNIQSSDPLTILEPLKFQLATFTQPEHLVRDMNRLMITFNDNLIHFEYETLEQNYKTSMKLTHMLF